MTIADKYESDILSGKIKASKYIILAMQRNQKDLQRKDIYFDAAIGQRAILFIETVLKHYKGSFKGKPFILSPWQQWIVSRLLGWKKLDGTRRFNDLYIEVPRKNGKTSLLAALALYLLLIEGEAAPELFAAATKEEQAKILVDEAAKIAKESGLSKYLKFFKYRESHKLISSPRNNGFLKPLGRDSDTLDGLNVFIGLIDEYHAHKTNGILDVLKSGAGARTQPLIMIITTAGFNKNLVCYQYRKYIIKLLNGLAEQDNLLALIYTLDEGDDWQDKSNWIKANPNYNISVMPAYLEAQAKEAISNPAKMVNFKTKHLDIWEDSAQTWITTEAWAKNKINELPQQGKGVNYAGLDLASAFDFNSLVVNKRVDNKSYLIPFFWLPSARVAEHAKNNPQIKYWIATGLIKIIPGEVMDWELMGSDVLEILKDYDIKLISYDRYKAEHGLIQYLIKNGYPVERLDPFSQAITNINEPTNELERRVKAGELLHDGNPVLMWHFGNVEIYTDTNGNRKPNRAKTSNKIDGAIASIMAIGAELTEQSESNKNQKKVNIRTLNI